MRRIAVTAVLLGSFGALTMGATTPGVGGSASSATFSAPLGFRTEYPATWSQREQSMQATIGTSLVWLSNQEMHDPCSTSVNGGQLIESCALPVTSMALEGIVVEWMRSEGPGRPDPATLARMSGRAITVGGQPGKLAIAQPGREGCEAIGATRVMHVTVIVGRQFEYEMRACLRGPRLSVLEAQVRQMLQATSFTAS